MAAAETCAGAEVIVHDKPDGKGATLTGNRKLLRTVAMVSAAWVVLVSCCLWSVQSRNGTSPTREGAPIHGLPVDAADIHWSLPGAFGPNTFVDFSTSEAGYRQWVAEWNDGALTGPTHGPYSIHFFDHDRKRFAELEISDGVAYTWHEEDRGVYMVYDREHNRAYFHSHSR